MKKSGCIITWLYSGGLTVWTLFARTFTTHHPILWMCEEIWSSKERWTFWKLVMRFLTYMKEIHRIRGKLTLIWRIMLNAHSRFIWDKLMKTLWLYEAMQTSKELQVVEHLCWLIFAESEEFKLKPEETQNRERLTCWKMVTHLDFV